MREGKTGVLNWQQGKMSAHEEFFIWLDAMEEKIYN